MMTKQDPVKAVLAGIQKKMGKTSALLMSGGSSSDVASAIPTGIEVFDNYLSGIGGLAPGRLMEVYGPEGGGKTSFALQCIAGAQNDGCIVGLAETEFALDTTRADTFGIDRDGVILMQPGSIEETMLSIETFIDSLPGGDIRALLVWDSVAQTPTQKEVDEGITGDAKIGERARALSRLCRTLAKPATEKNCSLLFTNQIRDTIGKMFGPSTVTPGGHAVKFYSSMRLQITGGNAIKQGTEHVGKSPTFIMEKNKFAPPWRKAKIRLDYDHGWNNMWSTITHAKDQKAIDKSLTCIPKNHKTALEKLGWFPSEVEVAA